MIDEQKDAGHHGFILGILVGILIALLFTTQKGRKLLKVISSEGSRKFSNLDELIALLERELGDDTIIEEEPVVGEDLKEEVKEIEPPKKVLRQAQDKKHAEEVVKEKVEEIEKEKVLRPAQDEEVEPAPEPEKIEKIDTEHLEQEIAEIKEEIKEVLRPAQDEKEEKLEKIETAHIEQPAPVEEPKKKSRRLFKGIRRK